MINNAHFEIWNSDIYGLAYDFEVNPSSCGNPEHFKEYLLYSALCDNTECLATTHVFIDDDANRIMGYVTLKASSLFYQSDGKYFGYPALEVVNLAVHKDYERRLIGTSLISYVMAEAYDLNKTCLGVQYIVLSADALAEGFYTKMEFGRFLEYWNIPIKNEAKNCVPMFLKLTSEDISII